MKTTNVEKWLKKGEHLPECLRDFHDQKAVFKAMHAIVRAPTDPLFKRPTWVDGQVYVIDTFLHFMARRGYTLQRTRRKGDFRDLAADVRAVEESSTRQFAALLENRAIGG